MHIVELDLSKNKIKALPEDFGALQRLQRLDLYQNQIVHIPVSFCHLKSLRWLDLKNNPLHDQLKSAAGECLNDAQCKKCAKNIVSFMKQVQSDQERKRQKKLQDEREKAAIEKAEQDKIRDRKRAERKVEKERRKKEYEDAQAAKKSTMEKDSDLENAEKTINGQAPEVLKPKEKAGFGLCGVFLVFLVGLIAVFVGLYFYCDSHPKDQACRQGTKLVKNYVTLLQKTVHKFIN